MAVNYTSWPTRKPNGGKASLEALCYSSAMNVLFVCRANVGRSQVAMAYYNKLYPGEAFSAGTIVKEANQRIKDRERAKNVIEIMRNEGLDIADNPRTQITRDLANEAGHIILMAEPDTVPDFLQNNNKVEIWSIEDPASMDLAGTKRIANLIQERVVDLGIRLHS